MSCFKEMSKTKTFLKRIGRDNAVLFYFGRGMLLFKKKSLFMFILDESCLATTDFVQTSRVITEIFSTPPRALHKVTNKGLQHSSVLKIKSSNQLPKTAPLPIVSQ
jgi:hypothetical protein